MRPRRIAAATGLAWVTAAVGLTFAGAAPAGAQSAGAMDHFGTVSTGTLYASQPSSSSSSGFGGGFAGGGGGGGGGGSW
jgi:hypothetical protein